MDRLNLSFILTLLGISLTAATAQANILTNGSFEGGTFTGDVGRGWPLAQEVLAGDSSTLPGWAVTGELGWLQSGQSGISTVNGAHALDLTGACDLGVGVGCGLLGQYGSLSQTISTIIGATYSISFLGGNYVGNTSVPTLIASAGDTSQSFTLPATSLAYLWETYTFDFIATSSSTVISFGGSGGAHGKTNFLGLDGVSVDLVSSPTSVPEPATLAFLAAGLIGLGARRHRKAA